MMPPLQAHLLLLLLLLLAASASTSAASFTCTKPSTCHPAIGYVIPNTTTYEQLISRFRPTTLHDLVAANKLPSDTAAKQVIPAKTTLCIPFRCRCTGSGTGQSDLFTVQTGTGNLEILTAKNILVADYRVHYLIYWARARLPCSCDKVEGYDVMHFAYIVRSGDNIVEIAGRHGVPECTLLTINNITNHTSSLRQGQILDIPLQGLVGFLKGICNFITEGHFGVIVGLLCVGFLLSLLYRTCYYWVSAVKSLSSGMTEGGMQFSYSGLAGATRKFSEESKIGQGAYGAVYKCTYEGQELAVKKMKTAMGKTKDVHRELQTISKTKHKNLVRLKGWCGKTRFIDGKSCWKSIEVELLLVFELIPNGSLENHLYNREQVLPWEKRYKIVKGIGAALHYLHHECNPCILHRDIKPGNILLDGNFNAKLADFGLSLITSKKRATAVAFSEGSMGYMDPQLQKKGVLVEHNPKSDIYSFGIVLLEIACMVAIEIPGKEKKQDSPRKTREEIWELYSRSAEPEVEAAADPKLCGVFDTKQMERVVFLGLMCSHPDETQRPSMEDAMKFLEDGQEFPATTQVEAVNEEEEAPMMPAHGGASSC